MLEIQDVHYQASEPLTLPPADHHRVTAVVVAGIIALLAVGGAYFWLKRAPQPAPAVVATEKPVAPPASVAAVETAQPYSNLPALDDSDPFVREHVRGLSTSAAVVTWLRGTGLVRNLAVVLDNVSHGLSPSTHLRALRPQGTFKTIQRGNRLVLDPRNYQRFAPIASAVASIDAEAAARVYAGIKPLLQTAYDELGNQEPIDRALERAARGLLSAPVVDGEVVLETGGKGVGYRFANPALESLPAAQKQLVRMGPANARLIQTRVREFALAAGVTEDGQIPRRASIVGRSDRPNDSLHRGVRP